MKRCIICGAILTSFLFSFYPYCEKCVKERIDIPHTAESNSFPEKPNANIEIYVSAIGASGSTSSTILPNL